MRKILLLFFALVINNQITYGQEVTIGRQTWMQKNLDVSKYRDGTPIPQVTDPKKWANLTTGAWCYYKNTTANGTIYGKLYNWYAVAGIHDNDLSTPNKILAPTGWHVPSTEEWYTLTTFLGGEKVAGGKMKSTGTSLWKSPNTAATNSSGFTALPGGYRNLNGSDEFDGIGVGTYWWSTTESGSIEVWLRNSVWYRSVFSFDDQLNSYLLDKTSGFSVRCLRDQVRAQEDDNEDASIYNTAGIEFKPDFPGGLEKFYEFIGKNFQIPKVEGLKGKIFLTFVVEKDGSLSDIKVLRDIGYGTGKEAIRVLKACPRWVPGEQNGKKVRVLYSLPISIQSDK
jgi:uncharacterized protein (TIGR02145 family)